MQFYQLVLFKEIGKLKIHGGLHGDKMDILDWLGEIHAEFVQMVDGLFNEIIKLFIFQLNFILLFILYFDLRLNKIEVKNYINQFDQS